ncbi:MAG TPA: hypothetical protein VK466_15225 [Terriglobales bacterium]|nr:hypothetical protein [Terriglobales bacterium]
MKRSVVETSVGLALVVAVLLCSEATPAPVPEGKIASAEYLVGTWDCAHTVGTFSGTYKTTYTKVLADQWLKQTYDFPPTVSGGRSEPTITAEALMGYDESRQAWVRFFANSLGQYFAIRMTPTDSGWTWKYVSYFPRTKPETSAPDAVFTRNSQREYVIEGPTYPLDGVQVTEHHTCRKQ